VAISTLIDDALLRPLPVLHPDDLVPVGFKGPKSTELVPVQSIYGLEQLRRQLRSDGGFSGWSGDMLSVPDQRGTLRSIEGEMVNGDALGMLGLRPYLGPVVQGGWPS
jgi:hypothetical protein